MKNKKVFISAAVIGFLSITVLQSHATAFISCWVNRNTTVNGVAQIMLRYDSGQGCTWGAGGAPDNAWFVVPSTMNDQSLAIGMTAISLNQTVRIGVEQCPSSENNYRGTLSSIGLDATPATP